MSVILCLCVAIEIRAGTENRNLTRCVHKTNANATVYDFGFGNQSVIRHKFDTFSLKTIGKTTSARNKSKINLYNKINSIIYTNKYNLNERNTKFLVSFDVLRCLCCSICNPQRLLSKYQLIVRNTEKMKCRLLHCARKTVDKDKKKIKRKPKRTNVVT